MRSETNSSRTQGPWRTMCRITKRSPPSSPYSTFGRRSLRVTRSESFVSRSSPCLTAGPVERDWSWRETQRVNDTLLIAVATKLRNQNLSALRLDCIGTGRSFEASITANQGLRRRHVYLWAMLAIIQFSSVRRFSHRLNVRIALPEHMTGNDPLYGGARFLHH